MTNYELFTNPIVETKKSVVAAERQAEINLIKKSGEDKKRRVLRFLGANSGWAIKNIAKKFNLECDVKRDLGNGLVSVAFFSDESMLVECFEITMPYSEVMATL